MSASQKGTGGRKTKAVTAPGAARSAREPKPVGEIGPSKGGISPTGAATGLPKPPQGHSGYARKIKRKPPRRDGEPPRYTNLNARGLMLQAARDAAVERGYEAMRITEITDAIGVTRQAFYAHFRDKRHCLAEVVDPKLAAIERMAASASEQEVQWPGQIAHVIDDVISEHFGSPEGTRGRLVSAMIELLRAEGTFHKVRIGALVKAAHVPPGDFYRQFSGKQECFAVAYERLLDELISETQASAGSAEPRHEVPECPAEHTRHDVPALLWSLAEALNSDPERRRILIVEMAHLPDAAPEDVEGARKDAFREAIAALVATSGGARTRRTLQLLSASILEAMRTCVITDECTLLAERLQGAWESFGMSAGPGAESLAA